jgi:cytochrome c5
MAEYHVEEHSSPIKTPKQLLVAVVLAFAVPITLIVMITQLVTRSVEYGKDHPAMSEEAIAKRLKPVGELVVEASQPVAATASVPAAAPASAQAAPAVAPAALAAAPAPAPAPAPAAAPERGKAVYEASCRVCHAAGVAGAPKAGDKAAWAPRLGQGTEALYLSALKGKNAMPPKGGNLSLPDAEVKAAVDYMLGLVK